MSFLAFILIFFSAGLHASWNLIAKRSRMDLAFYAVIVLVDALMGAWVWFALPLRLSQLTFGFYAVLCGTALSELLYCFGLVMAYRKMDMSSAYPMMRSLPLLLTALLCLALLTACGASGGSDTEEASSQRSPVPSSPRSSRSGAEDRKESSPHVSSASGRKSAPYPSWT